VPSYMTGSCDEGDIIQVVDLTTVSVSLLLITETITRRTNSNFGCDVVSKPRWSWCMRYYLSAFRY